MTMTNESKMLQQVRKWRREAFEADLKRSESERESDKQELVRRFGLNYREPARKRAEGHTQVSE